MLRKGVQSPQPQEPAFLLPHLCQRSAKRLEPGSVSRKKKARTRQTPARASTCALGLPARAAGGGSPTTGARPAGKSCVKVPTLRGFRHTNFTEEDPGGWNGTGRRGPLPPRSASPRRTARPVLCGLVERVRSPGVVHEKRLRQRCAVLPELLREEAGHC